MHAKSRSACWRKRIQLLLIIMGAMLFCLPVFAQLNLGRIYGSITDQSGGAMAGATVTIVDIARGISRDITTDGAGEFSASSLLPGAYTVRVAATGFKAAEHTGLVLEVGQDLRVDLVLQPGEQTQTVTVSGDVPIMNTTSATLGGTLENASIVDLPLNGRAFQKLLDYSPGLQAIPGGSTPTYNTNGLRGRDNDWMLDGVDEINITGGAGPVVGGNGGGVDGVTILSLDAIQEINVISNPKAEYGWEPGATINIGLKSGTNSIHGTAFAFGRDGAMDARNPFLGPAQTKATDNLTQYGASIGGPIKKDKIFYFGTYEGNRYTLSSPRTITEPTDAGGLGTAVSIPDAIANMNLTGHPLSAMSVRMAGCDPTKITSTMTTGAAISPFCGPASGAPASLFNNDSNASTVPASFNNVGGSDNALIKVDYHLNDHNTFNGEYFYGNGTINNASAAVTSFWLADNQINSQVVRGVWVWTPNSNWLNEMRFGHQGYSQLGFPADCNGAGGAPNYATTYGYNLGVTVPAPQCGFPSLTVSGSGTTFTPLGVQSSTGGPQNNTWGAWSGLDTVSYTHGKHIFKFGGEIHDTRLAGNQGTTNDNGTFTFGRVAAFTGATALQDFLAGVPATGSIFLGNNNQHNEYNRYAGFGQDDWRFTPRVTLNLGLRYEYVAPVTSSTNQLGNFDPSSPTGLIQAQNGNAVYHNPKDLFSPRFGVAWDVTGKGTTVIRAGASYMYNTPVLIYLIKGQMNQIPTGFALYEANGALATPQPGNMLVGTESFAGTATPSSSPIQWQANAPIINLVPNAVNSFGFACGNGLGRVNPALPVSSTNPANPSPCAIAPDQIDFHPTAVETWNLSVQHAFTNNLSLNIAYVGTHADHILGTQDINQPALGVANGKTSPTNQAELLRRPYTADCAVSSGGQGLGGPCFPYLGSIGMIAPDQISNYNGLQMNLQQRLAHGLTFNAGYTFSHALDESSQVNGNGGNVENSNNPKLDYASASFDARQHFTLTVSYDIPRIKAPLQLLQGWQVNVALTMLSALPYNASDTTDDLSGTGILQDRWTIAGSPHNIQGGGPGTIPCFGVGAATLASTSFASAASGCIRVAPGSGTVGSAAFVANMPAQCVAAAAAEPSNPAVVALNDPNSTGLAALANFGCYFQNGTAIVPPAQGTYGNMGRDVLRDRPFRETDLSITKSWKFSERLTAQFRGEFFNIFNAAEYNFPNANLASPSTFGAATSTPNTASLIFGNGGPRTVQLGLKLIF